MRRTLAIVAIAGCGGPHATPDAPPLLDEDARCPAFHFEPEKTAPSIELVIDGSGSMLFDRGSGTRFAKVRTLLAGETGVVTRLQDRAHVGVSVFGGDLPCPKLATVPRQLDNAGAIAALLDGTVPAGVSSPAAESIDRVIADFAANPPPPRSPANLVLATDGVVTTCDGGSYGATMAIAAAAAAHAAGIHVHVIAVDEPATIHVLQAIANAGAGVVAGQPDARIYETHDADALVAAFEAVIAGALTCELALGERIDPALAPRGDVRLNGAPLGHGVEWILDGDATIVLLGAACEALERDPSATVDVAFPCGGEPR